MSADLSQVLDFMEDDGGFDSPLMPSTAHPEGKIYRVPSPDAIVGLRLAAVADITLKQARGAEISESDIRRLHISDADEHEFIEQVLSPALVDQMQTDGCKWEHIKRLSLYAFTYFAVGQEAADMAQRNGLFAGKVSAPQNRAARRSSSTKGKSTTSGSGGSKRQHGKRA